MRKINNDKNFWPIKITIITFLLAILFSYLSQIAIKVSSLFLPLMILIIMIFTSIIADGIALSATSCDINRIKYITSSGSIEEKICLFCLNHCEVINNICADVIGDMCGILSGACAASIVAKCASISYNYLHTIIFSSLIVAITVGGKAYLKSVAVNSAEEFILSIAKIIKIFLRKKHVNTRKN